MQLDRQQPRIRFQIDGHENSISKGKGKLILSSHLTPYFKDVLICVDNFVHSLDVAAKLALLGSLL